MRDMASSGPSDIVPPQPRDFAGFNWMGAFTLYKREVRRFWKVGTQTVAAPVVTTLLYMLVFVVAVGADRTIEGIPYARFVVPGLIMMSVLNNAFANASSSLIQAKIMGLTPDFLTPPLSPLELVSAFTLGAATRGVAVGLVTAITIALLPGSGGIHVAHPWAVLYFLIGASLILGLFGILAGLWSEKFDQLAAATNFVIMPLTFLSGTFYLTIHLPEPFRTLSQYNPFFYLIDGFRYGFIGHADSNLTVGVVATALLTVGMFVWCYMLFKRGWRLKT